MKTHTGTELGRWEWESDKVQSYYSLAIVSPHRASLRSHKTTAT